MKKDNLLLLVPSLGSGGQERVAVRTAEILSGEKNVTIAIFNSQNAVYDTDANVINLQIPPATTAAERVRNVFDRVRALKRLKRELQIVCTISFGTSANLVNALARCKDRIVLSVRGYGSVPQNKMGKLLWHVLYKKADLVTCVSKCLEKEIAAACHLPKKKVCTVYNPYDFNEIFALSREKAPFYIKKPAVVSIGRLEDVKGFRHLIRAVKLASNRIPDLNLVIVGEGPIEKELRAFAKEMDVKVKFAGFRENPFSIVRKCSCYVLSSIHEGFPNALVEAMVCGIPVIATDCKTGPREILDYREEGEVRKIIEAEYGILCPAFESDHSDEFGREMVLAEAIVNLLSDPELHMIYRARAQVRAKMFSFEQYRDRLVDVVLPK